MRVDVLLFAVLRERAGATSIALDLPDEATVADLIDALRHAPELAGAGELPIRIAVNRDYAPGSRVIEPGDELAAITPVSGGAGPRISAEISERPLDLGAISGAVGDPRAGAIVSFQGTTREVELLRYEAYGEMARERIESILTECVAAHSLCAAAAAHRIGEVPLGEPSVIVAVSAPHRPEAFAGAREAIDRIKAEAPIWKQEVEGGEAAWVEGSLP